MPIVGILVPSLKSAKGMEIDMMIVNTAPMLIQNQSGLKSGYPGPSVIFIEPDRISYVQYKYSIVQGASSSNKKYLNNL